MSTLVSWIRHYVSCTPSNGEQRFSVRIRGGTVKPRIHVITLAVDDLDRSLRFYRDGLGLKTTGIIGTEFAGDEENPAGATVVFELYGGLLLSLYPRADLAKDAKVSATSRTSGHFSLGHAVAGKEEVDSFLRAAVAAGASLTEKARDRPWGIYSGYFRDPDDHLWEVLWNPALDDI
jgi:catechol 2,3-dioxygenase-like lactoylglutathione lyase family enzyme